MSYTPIEMPVGTRRTHCTVCGEMFLSGDAFDIHRGISKNLESIGDNDDLRQDSGVCMTHTEMLEANMFLMWENPMSDTNYNASYGTVEDIALAEKMAKARNNRN